MTDPGDPPSASPTTHAVAYGLNGNVYVTTPSGSRPHLLFIGSESASWSADGRRLVYAVTTVDGDKQLDVADANGRDARTLATLPGWADDLAATFSPDGRDIIYCGSADTQHPLFEISTRGGTPTVLNDTLGGCGDPIVA